MEGRETDQVQRRGLALPSQMAALFTLGFLQPCKEVGAGCAVSAPPNWPAVSVIDRGPVSAPAALLTLMSKFFPPLSCLEVLTDQGNKFQLQSLICVRRVFFTHVSPLWRISRGRSWSSRRRWRGWERRSASVRERARETEERKLGGRVAGSSDPNPSEKEETPNLCLPAAGKGSDLGLREAPRVVHILVGAGKRVCACARVSVYE